jgi:hypothetical protein
MARPTDVAAKATRQSRAKGGRARAENLRSRREEERRLLAEARRDRLDGAIAELAKVATKAGETIAALLDDENPHVRLRASIALLENVDSAGVRELADRLDRIEGLASANGTR